MRFFGLYLVTARYIASLARYPVVEEKRLRCIVPKANRGSERHKVKTLAIFRTVTLRDEMLQRR